MLKKTVSAVLLIAMFGVGFNTLAQTDVPASDISYTLDGKIGRFFITGENGLRRGLVFSYGETYSTTTYFHGEFDLLTVTVENQKDDPYIKDPHFFVTFSDGISTYTAGIEALSDDYRPVRFSERAEIYGLGAEEASAVYTGKESSRGLEQKFRDFEDVHDVLEASTLGWHIDHFRSFVNFLCENYPELDFWPAIYALLQLEESPCMNTNGWWRKFKIWREYKKCTDNEKCDEKDGIAEETCKSGCRKIAIAIVSSRAGS